MWRERYNHELYNTFNEPNTVNYIKVKRLAREGHMAHMNNNRLLKKILNTKLDRGKKWWKTETVMGGWS
jgi:hypothetical protein